MYKQLRSYLTSIEALDPLQSGLKKYHSTQSVMIKLLDDVRYGIDDKLVTVLVLFDFSKAFDLVDHDFLLTKLTQIGCSDSVVAWFKSYLTLRRQAVRFPDGSTSSWQDVQTGVPQGSVLGPLLFAIFINDISFVLKYCKYLLYADDLQIYIQGPINEIVALIEKVQTDVDGVSDWARNHQLSINPSKTKLMFLGSVYYMSNTDFNSLPRVKLNDVLIPVVIKLLLKILVFFIDSTLFWDPYLSHVMKRV